MNAREETFLLPNFSESQSALYQLMKPDETVLRDELAKKNFEFISLAPGKQPGTFVVYANKLHAVHGDPGDPVYVPVAITLLVTLDSHSRIKKIEGDTPNPKAVADTEKFAETLLANKQISGLPGVSNPNSTHQIERNGKGQQVIKRRNFSAY